MPELAATYGLTPRDVWALTNRELTVFLDHHKRLVKESQRGR
jgi:hypothetical protein